MTFIFRCCLRRVIPFMALLAAVIYAIPSFAYPTKPVTLVVPFGAGGGTDTLARMIAPLWEEALGQKIVVVNRPGGSGIVGSRYVLEAPADGYTVLMYQPPQINLAVKYQDAPFSLADFTFINLFTKDDGLFFTSKDSKWSGMEELIADAKKRPGEIKVGIALAMGMDYIYAKELEERAGIKFGEIIPLSGGGDLLREVMGGHIDVGVSGVWVARIQKGSITPLAARSTQRSQIWPDTPTVNELVENDYSASEIAGSAPSYKGIAVPTALKIAYPDRFAKLVNSFEKMMASEAFKDAVKKHDLGATIAYAGPDETGAIIDSFSKSLERYDEYFAQASRQ